MARVLIVEDEPAVRKAVEDVVASLEHVHQSVKSGNLAVPLLRKHAFNLIITDLFMQSGTGFELLAWLGTEMPKLPVIVCSTFASYAGPDAVRALSRSERMEVVKKPFRPADLASTISGILGKKK